MTYETLNDVLELDDDECIRVEDLKAALEHTDFEQQRRLRRAKPRSH